MNRLKSLSSEVRCARKSAASNVSAVSATAVSSIRVLIRKSAAIRLRQIAKLIRSESVDDVSEKDVVPFEIHWIREA